MHRRTGSQLRRRSGRLTDEPDALVEKVVNAGAEAREQGAFTALEDADHASAPQWLTEAR